MVNEGKSYHFVHFDIFLNFLIRLLSDTTIWSFVSRFPKRNYNFQHWPSHWFSPWRSLEHEQDEVERKSCFINHHFNCRKIFYLIYYTWMLLIVEEFLNFSTSTSSSLSEVIELESENRNSDTCFLPDHRKCFISDNVPSTRPTMFWLEVRFFRNSLRIELNTLERELVLLFFVASFASQVRRRGIVATVLKEIRGLLNEHTRENFVENKHSMHNDRTLTISRSLESHCRTGKREKKIRAGLVLLSIISFWRCHKADKCQRCVVIAWKAPLKLRFVARGSATIQKAGTNFRWNLPKDSETWFQIKLAESAHGLTP